MKELKDWVRPHVQNILRSQKRKEEKVAEESAHITVSLDKGENPYTPVHCRYPSGTSVKKLHDVVGKTFGIATESLTLSVGGDTPWDILLRTFCTPGRDNVVVIEPASDTIFRIAEALDVECRSVLLRHPYTLSAETILHAVGRSTRMIVLSNPNYPTAHWFPQEEIMELVSQFDGPVVVDESWLPYASPRTLSRLAAQNNGPIVAGNFTGPYAMSGLFLSYIIARPELTQVFQALTPATAIPTPVMESAVDMLGKRSLDLYKWNVRIKEERDKVISAVRALPICKEVLPSETTFFMMRVNHASSLVEYLQNEGIRVASFDKIHGLEDCIQITIGFRTDNEKLLGALRCYEPKQ